MRDLAAVLADRATELPEVKPYRELARDQQEHAAAGGYRDALARKRSNLAGMPALALPFDHARPALLGIRRGMVVRSFGADTARELAQLAERLAIPAMTLRLTAVLLLLRDESGQADVSIGLSDERNRTAAYEHTMGLVHDVDALRVVLPARLTGGEAIAQVDAAIAEAERDAVPAHLLIEALGQPLDPSRGPLAQTFFGVLPDRKATSMVGTIVLEPERVVRTPFADLAFIASDSADERFAIIYNEDVFERSTIERMHANLGRYIATICVHTARMWPNLSPRP
ncbi:MAG: condensation domain-containing protein [Kofleriaceae bacterium]